MIILLILSTVLKKLSILGYGQPRPSIDPSTSGVNTQPQITAVFPTTPVPGEYKGWRLYHPQESKNLAVIYLFICQ